MPAQLIGKFFSSLVITAALLLLTALSSYAHEATLGGSKWCFGTNRIQAAIELGASLFPEIRGVKERGYDLDGLSSEQLKKLTAEVIEPYLAEKLSVSVNGKAHPVKVTKVVLEGSLWRIWLSVDGIGFSRPENQVRIDYRLLFEETKDAHINVAYMYQSDAAPDEMQKVFDYSHPVAHHSFESNARLWEVTVKGTAPAVALSAASAPAVADAGPKAGRPSNPLAASATKGNSAAAATARAVVEKKDAAAKDAAALQSTGRVEAASAAENLPAAMPEMVKRQGEGAPNHIEATRKSVWSEIRLFLSLGIEHILTGYDHIAFLLALIVVGLSIKEVAKIITAFTVAHSITLLLAALQIVSLNARLVEIVIAFSICYVALENLFKKEVNYRWLLTFGFGLIHGFGFATVLQELVAGKSDLLVSVLSFNLGVEAGQLMIFFFLLPLLHLLKKKVEFRKITVGASAAVLMVGLVWLVERVFDLRLVT